MNRIKELRVEKHKTQKEIAKFLNITEQALSYYERGLREPKLKTWQALANYFDVPVSYLQGTSENKNFSDVDELLKTVKDKLKYVNDNLDTLVDDLKKDDDVDIKKIALELEKISEKMKKMQDNKKIFKD